MNDALLAPPASEEPVSRVLSAHLDAMFWRPLRLGVDSAWYGHLPFAHWLVASMHPRVLVELGTHAGVSYCGFCEAVQRANLDTRCLAVDTWTGDDHAGFYGEEVYQDLRVFHDARYAGFSTLLRTTFDAALAYVADASIDLLHIDGRHAYEDVRHDFDSWRPKLSRRAVVLFHDTCVRERGFGVWRLWAEQSSGAPHFEFLHCHGLGVLCIGDAPPASVAALCQLAPASVAQVRERFAVLGERWMLESASRRLESALSEQRAHVASIESKFRELEGYASALAGADGQRVPARAELRAALSRASVAEQEARLAAQALAQAQARTAVAETLAAHELAQAQARNALAETLARELAQVRADAGASQAQAVALSEQVLALRREREAILASRSWRVTQPLRAAGGLLQRSPTSSADPLEDDRRQLLSAPEPAAEGQSTSADWQPSNSAPAPADKSEREVEAEPGDVSPSPDAPVPTESGAAHAAELPARRPRVLFAAGEPGTPGCIYRCIRYAESAASLGWDSGWKEYAAVNPQDLIGTDLVVLWRVTWSEHVAGVIEHVHKFGGRVALDLDDLMIRPDLARVEFIDLDPFHQLVGAACARHVRRHLAGAGTGRFRHCHHGRTRR